MALISLLVPPVSGRPIPKGMPPHLSNRAIVSLWTAIKMAGYTDAAFPVELDDDAQTIRVPGDPDLTRTFTAILADYEPLPPRMVSSVHSTWAADVEAMLLFPRP